ARADGRRADAHGFRPQVETGPKTALYIDGLRVVRPLHRSLEVSMSTNRRHVAILLCLASLLGSPVSAQYFGQNKVQYRNFDFQVLKTEHFDVYFYPREEEGAALA